MTLRSSFWSNLRLLLAIHGFLGLLAGYWDVRFSDLCLFDGQSARIHYFRALQSHLALAILISTAFALYYARKARNEDAGSMRSRIVPVQVAFVISYLLFLIFGIKLHLVWLQSHLTDPEGLLWTGLLAAACFVLFIAALYTSKRAASFVAARRIASVVFLIATSITLVDAYLWQGKTHRGDATRASGNVLLIVADTLRADHVSAYGYSRSTTPAIDRLAKEGALYERAFSTSPWTTPSHASMFTGQYPTRNGVDGRNIYLNPAADTLAAYLARHGFQTAGFINNVYIRRQTGIGRGFQQYEEFWGRNEVASLPLLLELIRDHLRPRQDTGAAETRHSVEQWLSHDWNSSHPFFLFVHFMEPHAPYGEPSKYISEYLPAGITAEHALKVNQDPELYVCGKVPMKPLDFASLNALYDNDIRYMDTQIDALLSSFRARGLMDNTLVIFVSDHGEHFGDHGLMSHELSVYDELIHVPMILRHPATIRAGTRISNIVQTADLFPSILRFLNLPLSEIDLQGLSLLPESNERSRVPFAFVEYNNARAADKIAQRCKGVSDPRFRQKTLKVARSADLKLIYGDDGTRELYNVKNDPAESHNLYVQAPREAQILQAVLNRWSASFQASRFFRKEDISREALEELRSLGYIQ